MNTEKVEALLERIVEVANLALELNIGLQDFCDECCRTVIERLAEAEDAEMQALLQRTPLATPGPSDEFLIQRALKNRPDLQARLAGAKFEDC
jgi:hypothetical protein